MSTNFMHRQFQIRLATINDIPVLRNLIDASVRGLQTNDYTPTQMETALRTVFGVDSQLIADGTFLVVEANPPQIGGSEARSSKSDSSPGGEVIVACGGWSRRKTLYGGDQWAARQDSLLDPRTDAAKIRAFFVHPDWARRGIGTLLLQACEDAATAAGFTRFEMGATVTGVKLFQARGYRSMNSIEIPLGNGISLPVVHMIKQI